METSKAREFVVCGGTVLTLAAICAAVFFCGCHKKKPESAPPPPTVYVVQVSQGDVPVYTYWVATTNGLVNATIRAQVQGYLAAQNYKDGDFVRKGQLLFEIDPRTFEAAVHQAEGALSQAEAALNQAKAAVVHSQAQHYIAETNLERIRPLAEEHAISQMDLDNALGTERSTRADVVGSEASAGAAEANVTAARAALQTAELNLSFTKIMSPIDGIAGIATGQIGDLVGPSQTTPLTTVSKVDPILVNFGISEDDYLEFIKKYGNEAEGVERGLAVENQLILADGTVYKEPGTFYAMDRQVNLTTGTLQVQLSFPNPGNVLRPGQFARVRAVETMKGALLVPQRSVTELQGLRQVAVVTPEHKVDVRSIKTGPQVGTDWVVTEGLQAGELVVADGTGKVRQGTVVNPEAEPAPAAEHIMAPSGLQPTSGR